MKQEPSSRRSTDGKAMCFRRLTAFDLSLSGTGWAQCIEGDGLSTKTFTTKGMNGVARLDWIVRQLEQTVGQYPSDVVIIEDMAFAAHDRNHERAGLAWMIRHMLWQLKIPYILVAPTTLKKFVTGSGKGDKSKMQLEVYKHWHIDCKNDNEADAVGLLYMARALFGLDTNLTKPQLECLAVVRKNNSEALAFANMEKI